MNARRALLESAAVFPLSELGTICCRGADRARFLHGMITADVKQLTAGRGCYAFQLDEKGRILADLRVLCAEAEIHLLCRADVLMDVGMSLAAFVIADRVELDDTSDELFWIAIEGPKAVEVCQRVLGCELGGDYRHTAQDGGDASLAVRLERDSWTGLPAVWCAVAASARESMIEALCADPAAERVSLEQAEQVRIERGWPRFGVDFGASERSLVQETGLLHGVSFTKGCYRGQETVERVRSRGAVNRVLVGLEVEGALPAVGTKIDHADAKRALGHVTSAAHTPAGGRAIGYVRTSHSAAGTKLQVGEAQALVTMPVHEDVR